MAKLAIKFFKNMIMAFLILYGLNIMLAGLNFYIPINLITIGSATILGIPGILGLIVMVFIV